MNAEEKRLVKLATDKHGEIFPVGGKERLEDCFSEEEGMLIFWFNTVDRSTHIETHKL